MTTASLELFADDVLTLMRDVEGAALDASPVMKDALLVMIRSTQLNFEAGGRPRWDDLKDSTVAARARKALKGKGAANIGSLAVLASLQIMRDTGRLMQSVGSGASGPFDTGDGFGESDKFSAVIGTNAPGWQNQFPDSRGWRDAREFLLFQDQDVDDMTQMSLDWLMRAGPYATT